MLLERIDSPADLKRLKISELPALASEVRDFIVATVTETGGHLASSLGAVEITLGLHYVFESPDDMIVWDTGHQAYVHKIITGRRDRFPTLRQMGGLSGFPKRSESDHDILDTGHAATALPAAIGLAAGLSRDDKRYVIAVLGDAALTSGLTLEAINNLRFAKRKLLVVLNDNGMSISTSVGSISRYLTKLRSIPSLKRIDKAIARVVSNLPRGADLRNAYEHLKDAVFYFFSPSKTAILFEELGFKYQGPYDGHNIVQVIGALKSAKNLEGPVFLHFITTKGKGYKPAESKPDKYHGVAAQPHSNGKIEGKTDAPVSAVKTYTDVFGETLVEMARKDESICAVSAAMCTNTGLAPFRREFPGRFYDVGIAEELAVTFASGLAIAGKKPVVAIYSTFLQRAFDEIIHDVALQETQVVFALDRAGIVGADGETHQGVLDVAYLRIVPNLVVMAPKDEDELRRMMATALARHDGPTAIRFPRGNAQGVKFSSGMPAIPVGEAEVLRRGCDVAIVALGSMVALAEGAAQRLEKEGVSTTVVNARFVKPLDVETIADVAARCHNVVTVEESALPGGFGSAVIEALSDLHVHGVRVCRIGLPDAFIEHGSQSDIRKKYGLTEAAICEAALSLVRGMRAAEFQIV